MSDNEPPVPQGTTTYTAMRPVRYQSSSGLAHSPSIGEFSVIESAALRARIATLERELQSADELLCTLGDYMQERHDSVDGDEGDPPGPNEEMRHESEIDDMRERIKRALAKAEG